MTRKNDPELLLAILDTYTSGISNSLETVSAMNGVSFRSVYTWLRDETLLLDYMGEKQITFGKAMNLARNVAKAITISRSLEDRVLNGLKVQVWHHGAPSYVDDEAAISATDDDFKLGCDLGYFWPDKKKRDANGDRIIATKIEAPPAQLVEIYARANMPSVYGQKSEVKMTGSMSLGVTVAAPATRRPIPAEFAAYATAQDLEGVTETALLTSTAAGLEAYGTGEEVYEANSLDELLGLTPDGEAATAAPEPVDEPEPVMIREPVPTPPPAPILATPKTIPAGWRAEYEALQAKIALPDKLNRRA